jgi:sugar lactone lactonase YvrE
MTLRRLSLFTLVLLLATFVLVPVRADAPKTPTGKAPLELLVHDLRAPTGVAVDPGGTVYFTDRKEGRLWQRAPNGSLTILLERLEQPRGLVRGEDGTLYVVADAFQEPQEGARSKGVLLKRTPNDGTVSIVVENFRKPKQLAFDKDNRLLLSTRGGLRPQADPEGEETQEERDDDEGTTDDDVASADEDEETEGPPEAFQGTVFHINAEDGQILASHAGFRRPSGIVADEAGTLTVVAKGFKPKEPPLKGTLFQIKANGDATVLLEGRFKRPKGLVRDVLGFLFLAVKGDREKPKDGGLILKIAPDGAFTRFAQSFERPWGLTFDPQGNLYVTDPKGGRIYRFLAPAPPSLADHPATTREAQVTLAGTTEPEARITVRGGQEEVTALADVQGAFSIDVPLVLDQVNQLKVYATGAKGEGLTSATALAPIQQQATPPPPSIVLVLQINEPSPGATITSDSVLVRGVVDAGGLEVGVTVNGVPGLVSGTQWAVDIPLALGSNSISATASTVTGVQATTSITVQVTQSQEPQIVLKAAPLSGLAPLTVRFEVESGLDRPIVRYEFDQNGDGTVDFTGTSFEDVQVTYTTPGLITPTLRVTDDQGRTVSARAMVHVLDQAATIAMFQGKWDAFKSALAARDIPRATAEVAVGLRPRFQQVFQTLDANLPTIAPTLGPAAITRVTDGLAEGVTQRIHGKKTYLYFIYWAPDSDGIWRIIEM